jgi:alpha-galactosidase
MSTVEIGMGSTRIAFGVAGSRAWLREIGSFAFAAAGQDNGPVHTQGLAVVSTLGGRWEAADWECLSVEREGADSATVRLRTAAAGLEIESRWTVDPTTGVISRRDRLINRNPTPVTVLRCLPRLALPAGHWQLYAQTSRWCHESQGAWQALSAGALQLRSAWGRTSLDGTPFAAVRPAGGGVGLAFHVAPVGNWVIRFCGHTVGDSLPTVSVELGLADDNLRLELAAGGAYDLPEILLQVLPDGGNLVAAAPRLHQFLLRRDYAVLKPVAPVVFNTWFDQFELLDVPRLRTQLAAAKAIGCDVFTIDAGWYGAGNSSWSQQTGDWREKTAAAFAGRMGEFAEEVRAAGLGFGLWMEPERVGPDAPVRQEHPDWLVPCGEWARFDLENPAAYAWVRAEMLRLVNRYRLAWMKIDFNFELDADRRGRELAGYTAAWYRLLDEVRAAAPDTFFEGCASGALRLDLENLRHVDGHFLSDSVNPIDVLRISQNTWLRVPPGRLTRWAVLRDAGPVIPRYGKRAADSPSTVLVPGGALWEPAEVVDAEFALLAAMPGMLGLSGDLASLSPEVAEVVRRWLGFYKAWRLFIAGAVVHLLTPPEPLEQRTGWVLFQLQRPDSDGTSLLFVYRLGESGALPRCGLRDLGPQRAYTVRSEHSGLVPAQTLSGAALMAGELTIPLVCSGYNRSAAATVISIVPAGAPSPVSLV